MEHKATLTRQLSANVSEQHAPDCWNYACCRVLVRLIFNVLDLDEPVNEECDSMYVSMNRLIIDRVKEKCIKDGNDSAYVKILLYLFFISLGYTEFSCPLDGKETKGQVSEEVFAFFTSTVLNNPNFSETESVKNITYDSLEVFMPKIRREFAAIVFPIITRFQEKTNRNCVVKTMDTFEDLNQIRSILDKGLYIGIGVSFGEGELLQKYFKYRKSNKRPFVGSIKNEGGTHAMTVIKYNNVKNKENEIEPDLIQLTLKNSWGNEWGDKGTIDILSSELVPLCGRLSWVEPMNLAILTTMPPFEEVQKEEVLSESNIEIVNEVANPEDLTEKYSTFIRKLVNSDGNLDNYTYLSMYRVLLAGTIYDGMDINNITSNINIINENNNNDKNVNIDLLIKHLLLGRCGRPTLFDLAEKLSDVVKLPEEEQNILIERIKTTLLEVVEPSEEEKKDLRIFVDKLKTHGSIDAELLKIIYSVILAGTQYANLYYQEINEIIKTVNQTDNKDEPLNIDKFVILLLPPYTSSNAIKLLALKIREIAKKPQEEQNAIIEKIKSEYNNESSSSGFWGNILAWGGKRIYSYKKKRNISKRGKKRGANRTIRKKVIQKKRTKKRLTQ